MKQSYGAQHAIGEVLSRFVGTATLSRSVRIAVAVRTWSVSALRGRGQDPEHAPASLGTAHIVMLLEEAEARGLKHVYLGYRVEGCASLEYKARFGPNEILEGRPEMRALPVWTPGR